MKNNDHRKLYRPDYFGWRYYCQKAALRQRRYDKKRAKKAARTERKNEIREADT